jgi:hypothetical protein
MPTYEPPPAPLSLPLRVIEVARYDRLANANTRFELLPNVVCTQVEYVYGAQPPRARFEYVLDDKFLEDHDGDANTPPRPRWPSQFDELWPLVTTETLAVKTDDELVVFEVDAEGNRECVFSGFAQVPQVDLSRRGQAMTFVALGTPVRCFDTPIGGAFLRQGNSPDDETAAKVVATNLLVRVNPDGKPNCTPDDHDVDQGGTAPYPVFLDVLRQIAPEKRTLWTLEKFVRYLLAKHNGVANLPRNPPVVADVQWVENPDFSILSELLSSRRPKEGATFYDPSDPATYDEDEVVLKDFVATGRTWPEVLEELLMRYGFGMRWTLETDPDTDEPFWQLVIDRLDVSGDEGAKDVYLPPTNTSILDRPVNVEALHVARDQESAVNQVRVDPGLDLFEVSVVLAPGFTIAASDADVANRVDFLASKLAEATAAKRAKYRDYVADEDGTGHWSYGGAATVTTPLDLSSLLGDPDVDGAPAYVVRRRPGRNTLLSTDSDDKPLLSELAFSTDYAGPVPGLWDGTGTWQSMGHPGGQWSLMRDRLGVRYTGEDPNEWKVARDLKLVLRGVEAQAAPTANDPYQRFYLRLTTVIEGDRSLAALATRRDASPSLYTVERLIDARDDFRREAVAEDSLYDTEGVTTYVRDDAVKATSYATSLRARHEFPPFAGSLTIPWFSLGYNVGDRIKQIVGRDVDLRSNAGAGAGEAPRYPLVVAKTWTNGKDGQSTTLQLEDRRAQVRMPERRAREYKGGLIE